MRGIRARWRRRQERRALERAALDAQYRAWAATPEGQAYIAEYGHEDWESLH